MQTLSDMRRSRFNYKYLIAVLLFVVALAYESLGTIYPYLTPLLGVGFYYWIKNRDIKENYLYLLLFFCYTIYFEIDRSTILFSFILLALIYRYFIEKSLEESVECNICLKIIFVIYAYVGYYILNQFLALVFNLHPFEMNFTYLAYIITDIIIVVLFL